MDAWEDTVQHTWFTYYPICKETPDHIVGVLNSKSYLRLKDRSRGNVMKEAVEHAYLVPETLMADVLFKNMRRDRARIAVVLDEYGGLSGIITLRDLLEELVGELADETEAQEELSELIQKEENLWDVDGGILLETLTEKLGICLECEEYDTLNGLIFHHLGTSPEIGDTLTLENIRITVTQTENYQVTRATLQRNTDQI
jgi:putative hemolysin